MEEVEPDGKESEYKCWQLIVYSNLISDGGFRLRALLSDEWVLVDSIKHATAPTLSRVRRSTVSGHLTMPVFALLIISKAGSLIYHRTFPTGTPTPTSAGAHQAQSPAVGTLGLPGTSNLNTNDYLVLAGTFHGVHAITKSLTPKLPSESSDRAWTYPDPTVAPTGIESLESSFFRLTVFQTLTGTKFLLFTDPSMPNTDVIMKGVYERYADFVCKNPFWQMEMPIRIEAWERSLSQWLSRR